MGWRRRTLPGNHPVSQNTQQKLTCVYTHDTQLSRDITLSPCRCIYLLRQFWRQREPDTKPKVTTAAAAAAAVGQRFDQSLSARPRSSRGPTVAGVGHDCKIKIKIKIKTKIRIR